MIPANLRRTCSLLLTLIVALHVQARPAIAQASPAGLWRTISDIDGRPAAIIEIRESAGSLTGTVRQSLAIGDGGTRLCDKCSGERHGQPIVGMTILWGVRPSGAEWSGGSILDPDLGRIYKAKLRLADDGQTLIVRGFIGFSLLGRSQSWHREK